MASSSSSFPSSSISSTNQWTYDVFLSFNGEDTRHTATDFLHFALKQKGIYTFKDDLKLEKGKNIELELFKAIKESRFAVVILSKNYASSTWCLNELVEIIACEKKTRMTVVPIFYQVDPSDVRKQRGTFAPAFVEHEKQFKEKVGTWRAALSHAANIAGFHVNNSPLSEAVESIVRLIIHKSSYEFLEVTEGLVGMDSRVVELESCLALWLKDNVHFIGIWAMGGMGKTTLASVAYQMFSKEFEASCFIDNVREKDVLSLQKDLISQILNETNLNIKNKYDGVHMIKKILRQKKILLVLDDVNELDQLKMLAWKHDWFGSGSRIIITTRDKHLLQEYSVDKIFEVKALNYEDALCLFHSKAFKKERVPNEYLELSQGILEYVDGLPLALDILGSFLFGRSMSEWKNALEMLKEDPETKVNHVLKISFDGLHESVKELFLDIACFFNHEVKDHAIHILEILGRYPHIGLSTLIEKSLLRISQNNELWMHDLLEDMGRSIVRQKYPDEPWKRSRLWLYKDIDHVLKNNMGTKKVQAIDIRGEEACWQGCTSSRKQEGPFWNPKAFLKMSNLKFLRVRKIFHQHVPEHLPNSLRYLEWNGYPAKSLPCFQPEELVQLHLQHSKIEFLWEGMKNFDKLKSFHMAWSSNLIIVPDFNGVPNLEELVLEGCSNLRKLHPSIGKLKKLKLLDLTQCQELTSLPDKFEMESLVTLKLTLCSKVKKIPKFVGNMKHLQELLLASTAITELPSSIESLFGLHILILRNCKKLVCLPNTICSLTLLNHLDLAGCSKFVNLPENLGNLEGLKYLFLNGTAIEALPSSIGCLTSLKELILRDCKNFVCLPSTICSLKMVNCLDLAGCSKFVNLPENLGNLEGLKYLFLNGTAIEALPSSIGHLTILQELIIRDCKNLLRLPNSICNLKMIKNLDLYGCSKVVNLPENLGNLNLQNLSLKGIPLEVLPLSFRRLTALQSLDISDCKNLVCLPSNIGDLSSLHELYVCGTDLVSLPESVSQLSMLEMLNLDGCKRLRWLPDIPSSVYYINANGCNSLERFPDGPKPRDYSYLNLCVECVNCFKLDYNIQIGSNIAQGQSGKILGRLPHILPGKEIPNGFEKANIRDSPVFTSPSFHRCDNLVNIQLPGFDELWGVVLCVAFAPSEHYHFPYAIEINSIKLDGFEWDHSYKRWHHTMSKYAKLESRHLWLHYLKTPDVYLEAPNHSMDEKGSHQLEFTIATWSMEVETVGFHLVYKRDVKDPNQTMAQDTFFPVIEDDEDDWEESSQRDFFPSLAYPSVQQTSQGFGE